ncbi:mitogen-activated protein kinase kinase kinase 1-like [Pyrus ussuriensis x Pyrus communis]|uniref:mitogen-activated protein kinase kinase kinase n=1 Tax=Pyrus ussuriensis x Pyrus communis TaxID=2448454 RepID=A0A5N5HU43_9ROSA|nr:mitogen-activated protein kinase kinase kinase 1-like [Pyrus ussuriensis x Pyrus communis]
MHHIPRFFSHSKGTKAMDPKKNRRKPRLERRNAGKHFDYDAASMSSSLDDSSSSASLHTRSFDLDRTSFRVEGNEGDMERIYKTLGLGPDDFSISEEDWVARKIRSTSDVLPMSRLYGLESLDSPKPDELREEVAELSDRVRAVTVAATELTLADSPVPSGVYNADAAAAATSVSAGVSIGIKGVRPPVLRPPPSMRVPVIDDGCSTWDILRDFAPEGAGNAVGKRLGFSSAASSCSDEEEEGEVGEEDAVEGEIRETVPVSEETVSVSEGCSFTTSNDDDSSSTTTVSPNERISPNGRLKLIITHWEKGDLLGSGSFGSVYEAISDGGSFIAVKEVSLLDKGSQGKQRVYQLEQEIALLSQFEHHNIVQYYGTQRDESNLYIFLELVAKGSLQKLYQTYHLTDSHVSEYTRQILHGLKYLHDRKVVHRDIKCANILVHANGSVKLADFGLAKTIQNMNDIKSCQGTAFWMAPEVVNRKSQGYGLPADIWSLGCTVLEMLTGRVPYSNLEWMQALFKIGKGEPPQVPDSLSKDAQDFIDRCLQVDPNKRPSAALLLTHPFLKRPLPTSSGSASPYHRRGPS